MRARCRLPLHLGSGVAAEHISRYHPRADGFIVGPDFKADGRRDAAVDPRRVEAIMAARARRAA